jgi:hypothetical protein
MTNINGYDGRFAVFQASFRAAGWTADPAVHPALKLVVQPPGARADQVFVFDDPLEEAGRFEYREAERRISVRYAPVSRELSPYMREVYAGRAFAAARTLWGKQLRGELPEQDALDFVSFREVAQK